MPSPKRRQRQGGPHARPERFVPTHKHGLPVFANAGKSRPTQAQESARRNATCPVRLRNRHTEPRTGPHAAARNKTRILLTPRSYGRRCGSIRDCDGCRRRRRSTWHQLQPLSLDVGEHGRDEPGADAAAFELRGNFGMRQIDDAARRFDVLDFGNILSDMEFILFEPLVICQQVSVHCFRFLKFSERTSGKYHTKIVSGTTRRPHRGTARTPPLRPVAANRTAIFERAAARFPRRGTVLPRRASRPHSHSSAMRQAGEEPPNAADRPASAIRTPRRPFFPRAHSLSAGRDSQPPPDTGPEKEAEKGRTAAKYLLHRERNHPPRSLRYLWKTVTSPNGPIAY